MTFEVQTLTAPSHWATFLFYGDETGLEEGEAETITNWLAFQGVGSPVSCEDADFMKYHDACRIALASDCQEYTFLIDVAP
jgi:hypothetical protein